MESEASAEPSAREEPERPGQPPYDSGPGGSALGVIPPGEPIPWEQMGQIGFGSALYGTVWLAFKNAREFFLRIGRSEAFLPALLFGLLLTSFSALVGSFYDVLTMPLFSDLIEQMQTEFPNMFPANIDRGVTESLYARGRLVLFYPVFVVLWSGLIHALLRSFGPPQRGFSTTFRVVAYASAAQVVVLIPICGVLLAPVWELVLITWGLSRLHRVGPVLVLAVVLLPGILLGCGLISYFLRGGG